MSVNIEPFGTTDMFSGSETANDLRHPWRLLAETLFDETAFENCKLRSFIVTARPEVIALLEHAMHIAAIATGEQFTPKLSEDGEAEVAALAFAVTRHEHKVRP